MALFAKRKARKVAAKGERAEGAIVGIKVWVTSEPGGQSQPHFSYTVDVDAPEPFTASVDQYLEPLDRVRIGMRFPLSYSGDDIVLHPNEWGVQPHQHVRRGNGTNRGIIDETGWSDRAIAKAFPASITIVDARRSEHAGSSSVVVTYRAEGQGFDTFELERESPGAPFYASHLNNVGATFSGWARPGKRDGIFIDWISATMAHPGVDEPPGEIAAMFRQLLPDFSQDGPASFGDVAKLLRERGGGTP